MLVAVVVVVRHCVHSCHSCSPSYLMIVYFLFGIAIVVVVVVVFRRHEPDKIIVRSSGTNPSCIAVTEQRARRKRGDTKTLAQNTTGDPRTMYRIAEEVSWEP